MSKVSIVYPVLPPRIDGIGHHAANLAAALSRDHEVTLLAGPSSPASVRGCTVVPALSEVGKPQPQLYEHLAAVTPDYLLLEYNPFSYGRRGIAPTLPLALSNVRRRHPQIRIGLLAHETYCPGGSVKRSLLRAAQRSQYRMLGERAHHVFVSIDSWVADARGIIQGTPISRMTIGANIPRSQLTTWQAKERLRIPQASPTIVSFGTLSPRHRDPSLTRAALQAAVDEDPRAVAIYVGPDESPFRELAVSAGIDHLSYANLPDQAVGDALAAGDLAIAPFEGGVSLRRGSFLALLQQGLPCTTTDGPLTGDTLRQAHQDGAFELCEPTASAFAAGVVSLLRSPSRRETMSAKAAAYVASNHAWSIVANQIMDTLANHDPRLAGPR
jgi:glycosyltransferase involved in cell wall biosynthesis